MTKTSNTHAAIENTTKKYSKTNMSSDEKQQLKKRTKKSTAAKLCLKKEEDAMAEEVVQQVADKVVEKAVENVADTVSKTVSKKVSEKVVPQEEHQEKETLEEAKPPKKQMSEKIRRAKAKRVGYRSLAKEAGYYNPSGGDACAGSDGIKLLITQSNGRNLMTSVPLNANITTFSEKEFAARYSIYKKGVSKAAVRATQINIDQALRTTMNQAVLNAVESGKKRISASMMQSVLRPYASKMMFTAVQPPIGLIRHAQEKGVLSSVEQDTMLQEAEKREVDHIRMLIDEVPMQE